ncbi:MAG: response regulator [Gammaproteobacteria bacterium]|nr:response regulator [Gammaproteobacteria bacterium]
MDDDPHALRQAQDALAACYDSAVTAEPGQIARMVERKRPALAVVDLVLPRVDGIKLMRTLPALSDLPVILVSAYGEGETVARAGGRRGGLYRQTVLADRARGTGGAGATPAVPARSVPRRGAPPSTRRSAV